ncbi:MAG TPA: metallophosphoesterase family protein [Candidatus Polarisedimenticolia bacterium]|nr:metallophosphoesterase family protein [Candidatus Polarisedimenticolia bacterium]
MRHLILGDLHANLPALEAVLRDARSRGFDRAVCLGDIVGYGGQPNEVIEAVRDLAPARQVRGNHDKAASGISRGETFNDSARSAIGWTRAALRPASAAYLKALAAGPADAGGWLIAHGSPLDEEAYILGDGDAAEAFGRLAFPLAFFGHTHFACALEQAPGERPALMPLRHEEPLSLRPGRRYLVNPGSVGQPRDHDPRAAYVLYDDARAEVLPVRVPYDVEAAQSAIEAAGLPRPLGLRLALGV